MARSLHERAFGCENRCKTYLTPPEYAGRFPRPYGTHVRQNRQKDRGGQHPEPLHAPHAQDVQGQHPEEASL